MNRLQTSLAAVLLCSLTFGCAESQKPHHPQGICTSTADRDKITALGEEVLGRMCFTIEKADAADGIIRTRPLAAAQLLEFWRSDNIGRFNTAEANLHTIRKTAELKIEQKAEKLCIDCEVKTERLSMPTKRVSSSTQAYEMFTKSSTSMQRFRLHPSLKTDTSWLDLGRDAALEAEILNRLDKKLKLSRTDSAQKPERK